MNNYIKIKLLGEGNFGTVFHVRGRRNNSDYALKTLKKDIDQRSTESVGNEVKILKLLNHPNIVTYFDSFTDNGQACIVMAFCEAGTLSERIKKSRRTGCRLSSNENLVIFRQLCDAVDYIHKRQPQIIHRDIKPENIFFSRGQVKLGDFGVSKILDRQCSYTSTMTGTPCYMAPEVLTQHTYNNKCDIWSMGCVLYVMATCKSAFLDDRDKIIRGSYDPVPDSVDHKIRDLIAQLLNVKASERPSASEILEKPVLQNIAMSASSSEKQFDLILIGKTGNGKSSTGNTILGRQVFTVGDAGTSVTISTELGYSKLDSSVIVKVIDTPGIVDTRMDEAEQVKEAVNNLCQGFRNCPNGFHALVLILKYGSRYTQEEKYTIHFLKHLFGGSFIRDHCILIFTNGENFDLQARKTRGLTFEKWCEDQREDLGELIQECGNRVVLFYNMAPEKREEAVQRLLSLVQSIGKRYTSVLFEHIKEERDRILAGGGFTENMEKRLGVIISLIDRLKRATYEGDCYREALCDIKLEIAGLEAETDQEEQGKADLLAVWMIIAKIKLNIDRYVNQGQESAFGESFTLMDNSQMSDFYTGNRGLTIETVDPTVDTFQLAANTAQLTANTVQLAADIVQPTANTVQLTETYLTKEIGKTGDELQLALKKRANIIRHFANNFVTIFQRFLRLLGRAF